MTGRSTGRRVLPVSQRQHLAKAGAEADPADLDDRHECGYRQACRGAYSTWWEHCCRAALRSRYATHIVREHANLVGKPGLIAWPCTSGCRRPARHARKDCAARIRSRTMCAPRRWSPAPFTKILQLVIGANVAIMKAGPAPHIHRQGSARQPDPDHRRRRYGSSWIPTRCAGTPDDVFGQIRISAHAWAVLGTLLFFGQGGFLDHKDTVENVPVVRTRGCAATEGVGTGAGIARRCGCE